MFTRIARAVAVAALAVAWVALPMPPAWAGLSCLGRTPTIVGTRGADVLRGTPGDDVIAGRAGDDVIDGRGGDDWICGDKGADLVLGGGGGDWVSGGEGDDDVRGGRGGDAVLGLGGNDVLDGGVGFDLGSWEFAADPVTVDLEAGTASGEGTDELTAIEAIAGSRHDDALLGDGANNWFIPDVGDFSPDTGDDAIDGRGGDADMVFYFLSDGPVIVDLSTGTASGDGSDTLAGIEDVLGSGFSDTITGDAGSNELNGWGGADVISGGDGDDLILGDEGDDSLDGGIGTDLLDGGDGSDTCVNGEDVVGCEG